MVDRPEHGLLHAAHRSMTADLLGLVGLTAGLAIAAVPLDSDFRPNAGWQWILYGVLVPLAALLCVSAITSATRSYKDSWHLLNYELLPANKRDIRHDSMTGGTRHRPTPFGQVGRALWLSALGSAAGIVALAGPTLAILLTTDPGTRPDSGTEWSLYTYLLLPVALGWAVGGVVITMRLYRRAFQIFDSKQ